jgi:transcriptional regulator with GAF, ATPase, and Fis domain
MPLHGPFPSLPAKRADLDFPASQAERKVSGRGPGVSVLGMDVALESSTAAADSVGSASLASVLAEVADIASETLDLQAVFERVATATRRIIPLDSMGVVRIFDGQWAVLHAATLPCGGDGTDSDCSEPEPLTSWSPRLRPRPGAIPRVNDASIELNPDFPLDAMLIEFGIRSSMWEPFRMGDRFSGGVWVSSFQPFAFTAEHQELLRPIAALLGSAVEHWRIWDAERRRRERLDQIEALVGTLAESLDVREVFSRLSEGVQIALPHHLLVLTEFDLHEKTLRVVTWAGETDSPPPTEPVALSESECHQRLTDYELIHDLQREFAPSTDRNRLLQESGMRSWLRVPIRLSGEVRGSLGFLHREASRYVAEDVEVAGRLADRIALALSHYRLAEQARVAQSARERAERLEATVESLTRELETRGRGRVVGASSSWKEVLTHVGRVAPSETTVLVTGESGTGKEIVARLVRQGSPRAARPFVAVNCAALPEQLLESELFGHEKGAFTGAVAVKIGRIEQASSGVLFLDEIAEMSPVVQAKLLRVLEEREFQRLGGTKTIKADVRVIAATNRDLQAAIERGSFREDLYYRLNVFEIRIPALRHRPEDILPLAENFLEELGETMGRPAGGISRDAREWLLDYGWPGNVRELRNAIERAILLCDGGLITREHLPAAIERPDAKGPTAVTAGRTTPLPAGGVDLEHVERGLVERALTQARGNKSRAARLLGLTRAQLYSRLAKYQLVF